MERDREAVIGIGAWVAVPVQHVPVHVGTEVADTGAWLVSLSDKHEP